MTPLARDLLAATLARVPFDGWTWSTVEAAAQDTGETPATARRIFPHGLRDTLSFFLAEADRRMLEELAERDLGSMPIRQRIATAIRVRLEQAAPHREAIRRALALQMTPAYASAVPGDVARTVDAMWRAAGDTATDFNHYTKRALLAGVYGATLLHWLDDDTPDNAATWAFLERRIGDVMRIQKARGRLDLIAAKLTAPIEAALARRGQKAARDWQA
ncbi:MAG: COQ9 family protein [Alphaproteobacteria bacterium]|jgi:ubiquinone biosynthesis protein COQ9|nr:COQ9 family protein [Alphaproteobacteria bacterium]